MTGIQIKTVTAWLFAALAVALLAAPAGLARPLIDDDDLQGVAPSHDYASPYLLQQGFGPSGAPTGAAIGTGEGYSPQALQALGQRSQAMAKFYSQSTGFSPQALEEPRQHWHAMRNFYTGGGDAFDRALRNLTPTVVSDVGRTAPDVIQQPNRASIAIDSVGRSSDGSGTGNSQVVADDSFDWNTFGIAAGTGVLLVALLGVGLIGLRARGRVAHP
jgi:hypothetical protein